MDAGPANARLVTKLAVSGVAAAALLLHVFSERAKLDPTALALLFLALLPWLASVLTRAKLPGGVEFEFYKEVREVKAEQVRQAREIDALKFLLANFLTEHESRHLEALAADRPYLVRLGPTTGFFETEVRRLRALGFIEGRPDRGVRSLVEAIRGAGGKEVDVKDHFRITPRAQEYLRLRAEMLADPPAADPGPG